jgi:DNA uptake protein ComE-like DNA-binding protein
MGKAPDQTTCAVDDSAFDRPCLILFALLWITISLALADLLTSEGAESAPREARSTIDPNVAPWFELTALPRIGEVTAGKIVRYRESAAKQQASGDSEPVFRQAADLDMVHGIGPKTVQRLAPHLHFGGRGPSAARPDHTTP